MKTFVVAEIGSNWEGDLTKAKKIIRNCKKAGADGVKFQIWRANDLYKESHPNWNQIKKSEITFDVLEKLKKFSDEQKIEFFCSAFYPEAVEKLNAIGVKKFKIASRTCLMKDPFSYETLQAKAETKNEIIISMGMGGNKKKISNIFKKNKVTHCYCISEYPLKFEKIDWKKALNFDGFSDHTMEIITPILFTMLKKQKNAKNIYIEKHVKDEKSKGPDATTSITTTQLSEMIKNIRLIEKLR